MTSKERLPLERRWPIRAADLQDVSEKFATGVSISWTSWKTSNPRLPLTVDWTPDVLVEDGVLLLTHASIRIRPVATADRDWVRQMLIESGISNAIHWLDHALAAGQAWQSMRHERTWIIDEHHLRPIDTDGMQILDRELGTRKNKDHQLLGTHQPGARPSTPR